MTNPTSAFRTLIIYAIAVPVALLLGYMITSPLQLSSIGVVGVVLLILVLPLLLRWHHPLLILGWNASMIVFFLPGAPKVWLPLVAISLTISIVRRTIDRDAKFISVPQVTWPLLAMAAVVLATAEATGGIHMRSTGGQTYGGKNYVLILAGIAGYFALTAQRIPRHRAGLYVAAFLLGAITIIIGDVFYVESPAVRFLYWLFPPTSYAYLGTAMREGLYRFVGICGASGAICSFLLAKYGVRGIFNIRRPWRFVIFAGFAFASLLGGYRSALIFIVLLSSIQFFLEGLHRTKLLPILALGGVVVATGLLPFARHFPYSVQRALSFLPVPVDPMARMDAEISTNWRVEMWKSILPWVPRYLFLGKGYTITPEDFSIAIQNLQGTTQAFSEDENWAAIVGQYHSGPLSVIIPFGIWGVIALLWFLAVSIRVLWRNYRYGDPVLRTINSYLLAFFLTKVFMFFFTYGALFTDMQIFVGYVGFSIALNWGVASPSVQPVVEPSPAYDRSFSQLRTAVQPRSAEA